jgi:hypothetical protein
MGAAVAHDNGLFDPVRGITVREPDGGAPGHWAGCPGICRDPATGDFYLTYRRRRPRGAGPDRGYAGYIARSPDGIRFDDVWSLGKEELGSPSVERFCLRRAGPRWLLYISYVDPADNRWRIDVLAAGAPDAFDPGRRQPVLTAAATGTEGVKDPCVVRAGPAWVMYASYAAAVPLGPEQRAAAHATADIYNTGVTTLPTGLATSLDGVRYRWQGEALPVGAGWDRYQSRLSCVIPAGPAWLALYDGSAGPEENYEERCGMALSSGLTGWLRLTPDGPALTSPHATGSLRYVDAVTADDATYFYYEYARPDGAHELRVSRADADH